MRKGYLLSYVFGGACIFASLSDYLGHLWGRESPHPSWLPALFVAIGVGLMFPERLESIVGAVRQLGPFDRREGERPIDFPDRRRRGPP